MCPGTQHAKELERHSRMVNKTVTACRGHRLHFCAKKFSSKSLLVLFPISQVEHWLQVPNKEPQTATANATSSL